MELANLAASRPAWYDRNQITRCLSYGADGVAPHAQTTRWTYTVPAGRKALIEALKIFGRRATAAGAAATFNGTIRISDSLSNTCNPLGVITSTNTVDAGFLQATSDNISLSAGDAFAGQTGDASTGGTVDYRIDGKYTEFDA